MNTSLGLFGSGAEELIAYGISDVFFTIFKGGPGLESGERLDSIVEVLVTHIVGHSKVKFL